MQNTCTKISHYFAHTVDSQISNTNWLKHQLLVKHHKDLLTFSAEREHRQSVRRQSRRAVHRECLHHCRSHGCNVARYRSPAQTASISISTDSHFTALLPTAINHCHTQFCIRMDITTSLRSWETSAIRTTQTSFIFMQLYKYLHSNENTNI